MIAQDWTIALGREFLPAEDRGGQIGCIIGETVRQELFGSSDPVGQTIRVSNISSCPSSLLCWDAGGNQVSAMIRMTP